MKTKATKQLTLESFKEIFKTISTENELTFFDDLYEEGTIFDSNGNYCYSFDFKTDTINSIMSSVSKQEL